MVAADAHLPDAARSGLFQRQAEHLGGIAVLPLGGADAVADVPAVGEQIVVQAMPPCNVVILYILFSTGYTSHG